MPVSETIRNNERLAYYKSIACVSDLEQYPTTRQDVQDVWKANKPTAWKVHMLQVIRRPLPIRLMLEIDFLIKILLVEHVYPTA